MHHFDWDYLPARRRVIVNLDVVNQFFRRNLELLTGAVGLHGKTEWEIHECQTWEEGSIIQAEIALVTLTPFLLHSQGSRWLVAPDGLLKASLSGPVSLMNTAPPATFPPVTGVWPLKAVPPFVYLLLTG